MMLSVYNIQTKFFFIGFFEGFSLLPQLIFWITEESKRIFRLSQKFNTVFVFLFFFVVLYTFSQGVCGELLSWVYFENTWDFLHQFHFQFSFDSQLLLAHCCCCFEWDTILIISKFYKCLIFCNYLNFFQNSTLPLLNFDISPTTTICLWLPLQFKHTVILQLNKNSLQKH